jgi:hypothetical protein
MTFKSKIYDMFFQKWYLDFELFFANFQKLNRFVYTVLMLMKFKKINF